jgi:hypothetical protein
MTALISLTSVPRSSASGNSTPVLSITHGLHQGVNLTLDNAVYIIGSASSADLILSDAGIAERHMVLRFVDGRVAVEALGGDVVVVGLHGQQILIPKGKGHRARLPLQIGLGEARLRLDNSSSSPERVPAAAPASIWRRKLHWLLALVLMVLCVSAFALRGEPTAPVAVAVSAPAHASQVPVNTAQAHIWLEQQLFAADLKGIRISESGGQLIAEGAYDPTQKPRWIALQQAYDQRFGQQVLLQTNVAPHSEIARPRVRFQAVWFGTNPYVINDSGRRLYPGAALTDGWMLERIENNQVILAKGEERFTLTL